MNEQTPLSSPNNGSLCEKLASSIESLPPSERDLFEAWMAPRSTTWAKQTPTAKQRTFLKDLGPEVYYGGSAGPGKSSALLMGALQYVDTPGYAALIIRKNFSQLSKAGALIPRSHEWLDGTEASWNGGRHEWTFPSGATLTFGHIAHQNALADYQGAEVQYIAVDEVTDFDENTYTFLFSRLRRLKGVDVPLRMRSASNPIGPGAAWVKRRFVNDDTREPGASFVRAVMHDNPHLDWDEYVESLKKLHPVLWRRLLHGDWDVTDVGEIFQPRLWLDGRMLEQLPDGDWDFVRGWDLAATEPSSVNPDPDWTATVKLARHRDSGRYVICDAQHIRRTSGGVRDFVKTTAERDGSHVRVALPQDPGQAGKDQARVYRYEILGGYDVYVEPVSGDKVTRASRFAGAMEQGTVDCVLGDWNDEYFAELEGFPAGAHDDLVDASSSAFKVLEDRSAQSGTAIEAFLRA